MQRTGKTAWQAYFKWRVGVFLFLGLSCGVPLSLIGFSLIVWMKEAGVSLPVVGLASLVLLPYSLKFLWAPLVDRVRIPYFGKRFGHKKTWALLFQAGLIICIWGLAGTPADQNGFSWLWTPAGGGEPLLIPAETFLWALGVAFFSASQDIAVDALRIDTLPREDIGAGASLYQFGARMGMLLAGAGVVAAPASVPWRLAYMLASVLILLGMAALFKVREEPLPQPATARPFWHAAVVAPLADFARRAHWPLIFVFIIAYKLCNAFLGRMALPFYSDMGFSKAQIALVSGAVGPWITIAGIALGGLLMVRIGILRSLLGLGIFEIGTSVAFAVFALLEPSLPLFFTLIVFDNITGGMGGAVFVAYLSSLCSRAYSATQYALLTSLMMISVSLLAAYSGFAAERLGWFSFFMLTGLLMLPALGILLYLMRHDRLVSQED